MMVFPCPCESRKEIARMVKGSQEREARTENYVFESFENDETKVAEVKA